MYKPVTIVVLLVKNFAPWLQHRGHYVTARLSVGSSRAWGHAGHAKPRVPNPPIIVPCDFTVELQKDIIDYTSEYNELKKWRLTPTRQVQRFGAAW